jgi:hypothetical protein
MTEKETDDMAQNGKRYNPNKMVHASDGETWNHFVAIHRDVGAI